MLDIPLSDLISAAQKTGYLEEKVESLESKIEEMSVSQRGEWFPIAQAAEVLGKTVSALRQRLKHRTKPMKKGVVWKQADPGCESCVNIKKYQEYICRA